MWRASWAVGRWPWDAGRWPSSGRSGPPGSGASDRAPGSGRSPTDRGPRIVGRAHRIASPWSTDADQVHRMPTRCTGCRPGAPGADQAHRIAHPGKRAGAPADRVRPRISAFRQRAAPPGPRAQRSGARAMFLANIYLFFRIGSNCLIFAVKIAYITCYVPRETSKTAYQKLAGAPDECSAKCGVRREKAEA